MNVEPAPFLTVQADGPADGAAYWLMTADKRRIRAAAWGRDAARGTVFLFPGRTEYVEKYGRAAGDLHRRGFATLSIDWRGQGLSSRALADPLPGHVDDFAEFQQDIAALYPLAEALNLPKPFFLLSHSMGGAIALRCLMGRHPFRAAAFSAPMWGILMAPALRPVAWITSALARPLGFQHRYAPSTGPETYVLTAPFAGNTLTKDETMWIYMRDQILADPRLALGGPTVAWLGAALRETRALAALPSPDLPCLTVLGSDEKIVDPAPIHARMARWPKGRLQLVPDAEHEIMMECQRAQFFDAVATHFATP